MFNENSAARRFGLSPGRSSLWPRSSERVVFKTPEGAGVAEIDFWDPNEGDDSFGEESAVRFAP